MCGAADRAQASSRWLCVEAVMSSSVNTRIAVDEIYWRRQTAGFVLPVSQPPFITSRSLVVGYSEKWLSAAHLGSAGFAPFCSTPLTADR